MKRLFTVILLLFCLAEVKAQKIMWEHIWVSPPDSSLSNQKVLVTKKNEVFVLGSCVFRSGIFDFPSKYLLKYDQNGNRIFANGGLYTEEILLLKIGNSLLMAQ